MAQGGATTTVDLREKDVEVQDLLRLAESDSILIIAKDDHGYTLEGADDLRKKCTVGVQRELYDFLQERDKEEGSVSLEESRRG